MFATRRLAAVPEYANVIRFDFSGYPNITRWLEGMKSLPNWPRVNAGFNGMVESRKGQNFLAA